VRIRGIDWGSYVGYNGAIQLPWSDLINKANVGFAVYRGCQEDIPNGYSTQLNLNASRGAGVPINACYYWHYPYGSMSYWVDLYSKSIDVEKPDFISVDIEQYWDSNGTIVSQQQISDTAQALCEGLSGRYPEKQFVIYTRKGFPAEYSPMMSKWMGKFKCSWLAGWPDYGLKTYRLSWDQISSNQMREYLGLDSSGNSLWKLIDLDDGWEPSLPDFWNDWFIWQYSSRILLPEGISSLYDHQYDWNIFHGDLNQMKAWLKGETITYMASLYNTSVAQNDRAKILTYCQNQKLADGVTIENLGVDAVILPMGGIPTDGTPWTETTFGGRCDLFSASMPVMGSFKLDPGALQRKQHSTEEFNIESGHKELKDNWILPYLLAAWAKDTINPHDSIMSIIAKTHTWRNVSAIILQMTDTDGYPTGKLTTDVWQQTLFRYIAYHLRTLQSTGIVPNIPIILYSGQWWLSMWPAMQTELDTQKSWLYLQWGEWTQFNTHTFDTVAEMFTYRPADTFKFAGYPDGYFDRILMHEFMGSSDDGTPPQLLVKQIVAADDQPTTVSLSLWCDTKEAMYNFLSVKQQDTPSSSPSPSSPPVENNTELEKKVGALEELLTIMQNSLSQQDSKISEMTNDIANLIKWKNSAL
jgi:hypothetical protein